MSIQAQTYLVASCTERKRAPIPEELHLRSIDTGPTEARLSKWWSRLERQPQASRCPADRLYGGEHWVVTKQAYDTLRVRRRASLWVASAGYGLIPSHARLSPYSATFASGVPDSVWCTGDGSSRIQQLQTWWKCLSTLPGPQPDAPRSLSQLAETSPKSAILVVASPDYIRAMRPDLLAARESLVSPKLLTIVSNWDLLSDDELSDHLIPVDERSKTVLGGSTLGLNARVALSLVEQEDDIPLTAPHLRERYESMVSDAEKPPKFNRDRMNDEDVLTFLRSELAKNPRAGWTILLRTLRGSGRACEQGRFRELHKQVREEVTEQPLKLKLDQE